MYKYCSIANTTLHRTILPHHHTILRLPVLTPITALLTTRLHTTMPRKPTAATTGGGAAKKRARKAVQPTVEHEVIEIDSDTSITSPVLHHRRASTVPHSDSEYSAPSVSVANSDVDTDDFMSPDSDSSAEVYKPRPIATRRTSIPRQTSAQRQPTAAIVTPPPPQSDDSVAAESVQAADTSSVAADTVAKQEADAADDTPAVVTPAKRKRAPRKKKTPVTDNDTELTDAAAATSADDTATKPKRRIAGMHGPENVRWRAIPALAHAGAELAKTGMKVGFPCLHTVLCTPAHTFRLKSYTPELFRATVWQNLCCLTEIIRYTAENGMLFFRLGSGMIPFASHPVLDVDWQTEYAEKLADMGDYVKQHNLRLSFHPDQFCLINAVDEELIERSIWELQWHADFFDCMQLDDTHKMQIHVGGVYGNKQAALDRWCDVYNNRLSDTIKRRLVIENDDKLFTVKDCLYLHQHSAAGGINGAGVPILFDNLHHACLHNGEPMLTALEACLATWTERDGIPLTDYSTQDHNKREKLGAHAEHVDDVHFEAYMRATRHLKFDVMLEIKGKERAALVAMPIAANVRAGVDIDFNDFKPKSVFALDEETGEMVELHKIDDIKNGKRAVGKAEDTKRKKAAEMAARAKAAANSEPFDLEAWRESVKIANRQKGAAKRAQGPRADTVDYTHLTGDRVKLEMDDVTAAQMRRAERERLVAECDVELANVSRELVVSRLERFVSSNGASTAKASKKKAVKTEPVDDAAVKTEASAVEDGEAEFHLSTAGVNGELAVDDVADDEQTPVKAPQRVRRVSAAKAATKFTETASDDDGESGSMQSNDNENVQPVQQAKPVLKAVSRAKPTRPRIPKKTAAETNEDDEQHTTPALKRVRKQSAHAA